MKYLKIILLSILVVLGSLKVYELLFTTIDHAELIGTEDKYVQLNKNLAKLKTKYRKSEDIRREVTKRFKEVRADDLKKIKRLSDVTFTLGKHIDKNSTARHKFETKSGKKGYILYEFNINGPNSPPSGYILVTKEGKVRIRYYKSEFHVESAISIDDKTGRSKVFYQAKYTLLETSPLAKRIESYSDQKGIPYKLFVNKGTTLVDPTRRARSRHFILTPKISLGIINSSLSVSPVIGLGIIHIGTSKEDISLTLLEIGGNDKLIYLAPVKVRFSSFLSNTKIGLQMNLGSSGIQYGLIIGVEF